MIRGGLLLTSAHVVTGARDVGLAFADGRVVDAEVVGSDVLSDLAVLRAHGPTPDPVSLGDAARLRVGQLVIALGNPRGLAGRTFPEYPLGVYGWRHRHTRTGYRTEETT